MQHACSEDGCGRLEPKGQPRHHDKAWQSSLTKGDHFAGVEVVVDVVVDALPEV